MTAHWDSAYIKGLPQTMTVRKNVDGKFVERQVRTSYEDPYTKEFKEFFAMCRDGKNVKTTLEDTKLDFEIMAMIMKGGNGVSETTCMSE